MTNIQIFISSIEEYAVNLNSKKYCRSLFSNRSIKDVDTRKTVSCLQKVGYELFSIDMVCFILQTILTRKVEDLDQILKIENRQKFSLILKDICSNLEIKKQDGIKIFYEKDEIVLNLKNAKIFSKIYQSDIFFSFVEAIFRDFTNKNNGLLIILRNEKPYYKLPSICFCDSKIILNKFENFFNKVIIGKVNISDIKRVQCSYNEILAIYNDFKKINLQHIHSENVKEYIQDYPLMQFLKKKVKRHVKKFLNQNKSFLCDPLDLEYQVMFRITSFDILDIFNNAHSLVKYIESVNKDNLFGLYNLKKDSLKKVSIVHKLLDKIIKEQYQVIATRLKKSKLPIKKLLNNVLFHSKLVIQKDKEGLFLKIKNKKIRVDFKEVDKDIAISFHNDLHYIHTPRCNIALGFFIRGEKFPFSVLTITKIDRQYKSDALIIFGFDPRNCFDFTRLYSVPNAPKNISSCIFKEAFGYLRNKYPKFQAALSAFMPSYASGNSMLTSGFDYPIMFKTGRHFFKKTPVQVGFAFEHVTKRRFIEEDENYLESIFPLIPVVELISVNSKPTFEPLLKLGKDALVVRK